MAENLKRSTDELQPPDCPHCSVRMKWYWSMKVADNPVKIDHFFDCPKCRQVIRLTTVGSPVAEGQSPEGGLALPFASWAAA